MTSRARRLARSAFDLFFVEAKRNDGVLALVIAIALIAVATTMIATVARQNKEAEVMRASRSSTSFGKIEDALLAYAISDHATNPDLARFPCAADPTITGANFGIEGTREGGDALAVTCEDTGQHNRGLVPFKTLGLTEDDVKDAYGNYITYIVSTDTSMCNADTANVMAGTVTDAADSNTYLYTLISHGKNGLGAYGGGDSNTATQKNANNMSAFEALNCPNDVGNCTIDSGNNQQVRSGPLDTADGSATYFDDRVFFPVTTGANATSYTANCEQMFEDESDPAGSEGGGYDVASMRNKTLSADNTQTDTPQRTTLDLDGDGTAETDVLQIYNVGSTPAAGERACNNEEQTFPLLGHTIRAYSEVYFAEDTTGTLGNGVVLGWLGYQDDGGAATRVITTTCGGRDEFNGWGQEDATNTFNTTWERFGLEIDTRNHRPAVPVAGDIIDPDNNHFAIVLGNVDHFGLIADTAGEDPEDNSPVCLPDSGVPSLQSLALNDAEGDGTAPADRSSAFSKEITGGVGGSNTDDQACYFDDTDANWLEDGEPTVNPGTEDRFHRVRSELHGESSNNCAAGQFRYDAWIWRYSDDECVDENCDDLTIDYTGEEPHISQCVDLPARANAVRFVTAAGLSSANSGRVTLKRTGLNFQRVNATPKSDAASDFVGTTITELGVRNGLFSGAVNATDGLDDGEMDQSWSIAEQVDNTPNEVSVFASRGIFDLNGGDGISVDGVGFDANHIDNIRPNDATYDPLDDFLDVDLREKLVFEWESKIARVTINLRDFGDDENAAFTFDNEQERVRIRAFDTSLPVGSQLIGENIYQACRDTNGDGTGVAAGDGVISTSFDELFDKIEVIPEPIRTSSQDEYLESWSMILVSAVKGCGADETCGFAATDAINASQNQTENRCSYLTFPQPTTTSLTIGTEVNPTTVVAATGRTDNTNDSNYDRAWIDFSESGTTADLGVDIYTVSGQIGVNDTAAGTNGGFGITSDSGTGAGLLDTLNPPTGISDESDRESIFFRFDQRWDRIVVGLSRFGRIGGVGTANERARIRAYAGGVLVGTATIQPETVGGSCDFTNSANSRFDATINAPGGTPIDTIEVTAMANSDNGQSSFYVRGLKPCPSVGICAIDYGGDDDAVVGNPDNDAGDLFCESTFNL